MNDDELKELSEIEQNSKGKVCVLWETILNERYRKNMLPMVTASNYDQSDFDIPEEA